MNNSIYFSLILLNKNHNNHFLKRYVKLVSFFKERNWSKQFGLHEHHIIPKAFDGPDSNQNLVFITIREHFILHWMLYKAFPKSKMVTAFKSMCCGWRHYNSNKVSSKVYENAMLEFAERHSETMKQIQNKRVLDGTHLFSGGEIQRESNKKRLEDGTHHLLGKNNPVYKIIAEGNHHFSGPENMKKRLENGTHPSQIKKLCPHCNREFSLNTFAHHHGDKCKLNPFYVDERKSQPKILCEHCNKEFGLMNFSRWHGDKCKLNLLYKEEKIECHHCKIKFDKSNFSRWHGDKCKLNPLYKNESIPKPKIECQHCNRYFSKNTFIQHHDDKCKLKPNN